MIFPIEECHQSLANLSKIVKETESRPDSPKIMKVISHMDAKRISHWCDLATKSNQDMVDIIRILEDGIRNTIEKTKAGAKRDEVIASLKETMTKAGYAD